MPRRLLDAQSFWSMHRCYTVCDCSRIYVYELVGIDATTEFLSTKALLRNFAHVPQRGPYLLCDSSLN
jgi:hypothetical protein